jgi:D-threonate/D-erythronate kinase
MRRRFLAVIADDLTGALDTGVQFQQVGLSTEVQFAGRSTTALPSADVVVIDTETRSLSPAQAARCVWEWARRLRAAGASAFYKKIDSTLRGPWAQELKALHRATGASLSLVCPAYPAHGRVVRGGKVWLQGSPRPVGDLKAEGGRMKDEAVSPHPVGDLLLDLGRCTRSAAMLPDVLQGKAAAFVVADAETDEELDAIAAWAWARDPTPLLCGSAGLAAAWARLLSCQGSEGVQAFGRSGVQGGSSGQWSVVSGQWGGAGAGRVLVVAGSRDPVTWRQVRVLGEHTGVTWLSESPEPEKKHHGWDDADEGAILLLAGPAPEPHQAESAAVAQALASVVPEVIRASSINGLILTGGETAIRVLRVLGATGVELCGEALPGIPASIGRGGAAEGLWLVTKAGGFGETDCLVRLVSWLRG